MQRFFYVYVLVSEADETIHYTGTTQDLQARLTKHNQGLCAHRNIVRGEFKPPSLSVPNLRPVHSRNI